MAARLEVRTEAGGVVGLCMLCPPADAGVHPELFVVIWDNALPRPQSIYTRRGGCLRLCWEHLDELAILIAEVL